MTIKPVYFLRRFVFLCMIFCSAFAFSQEQILLAYQRNFIRASLPAKPGILRDAATDYRSGEFIGALYEFALQFTLDYSEIFRDDSDMITLTVEAARGIGTSGRRASVDTLWKVFMAYRNSFTRVEILEVLLKLGKDDRVIQYLNEFFVNQNDSFRSGVPPDYTTLSACISTLGAFGEASSFPALFSGLSVGYTPRIYNEIQRALESLQGNYQQTILDILQRNPPADKLAAFRLGTESEKFRVPNQGEYAKMALEIAMDYIPRQDESVTEIDLLRYYAIQAITRLRWIPAGPLAIKHYYRTLTDYQNGAAPKERLLEAISCLGVMGNIESSQVLALQLSYYNSRMEYNAEYDTDIILRLIQSLREIGDRSAFDNLLYVSFLNYPEQIQAAAREALNRIIW
jgi:hypothetical protein